MAFGILHTGKSKKGREEQITDDTLQQKTFLFTLIYEMPGKQGTTNSRDSFPKPKFPQSPNIVRELIYPEIDNGELHVERQDQAQAHGKVVSEKGKA